jgi:hypothetical protein
MPSPSIRAGPRSGTLATRHRQLASRARQRAEPGHPDKLSSSGPPASSFLRSPNVNNGRQPHHPYNADYLSRNAVADSGHDSLVLSIRELRGRITHPVEGVLVAAAPEGMRLPPFRLHCPELLFRAARRPGLSMGRCLEAQGRYSGDAELDVDGRAEDRSSARRL